MELLFLLLIIKTLAQNINIENVISDDGEVGTMFEYI
jgi:hypothetical protein